MASSKMPLGCVHLIRPMPFANAARAEVQRLQAGSPRRIVLQYLLDHGIGVQNAKSWRRIAAYLEEHDIEMSREQFQQTILADTRSGTIFIGSTDHGRTRGYFLIGDRGDAGTMREFYRRRIAAEQQNLATLERLMDDEWPQ